MSSTNGTAKGVSLQAAAAQLGVSVRTIRRHVARQGLPKMHAPADAPGQWARVLLSPDSLDAIALAVSKGTEPRPTPGVQGDTAQDSPGQRGADNGETWTSPGQDSGQPRTSPLAPDTLSGLLPAVRQDLADTIRQAVAQGVLDALQRHQTAQDERQDFRKPPAASKARRWAALAVYALLVVTLGASLGAAFLLASRIASIGVG